MIVIFLPSCSTLPKILTPPESSAAEKTKSIYITSHGWHTGIVIEANVLAELLPNVNNRFSAKGFLEVGWGDSGFYQAKEITSSLTVQAIFWPTSSVVHIVGFNLHPEYNFPASKVVQIKVSEAELKNLAQFLASSFARSEEGKTIPMRRGLYGDSQFYRGVGNYHLFNTCNKWTAKALYSSGQKNCPMFMFSASSVMSALEEST